MKRTLTLFLLTCLLLTSCRFAQSDSRPPLPTPSPVPVPTSQPTATTTPRPGANPAPPIQNVRYSDEPVENPKSLSLDIYPTDAKNIPVVVYVHGGGWQRGTKSNVEEKPAAFNSRAFVFVAVNYRLIPEVNVEQEVRDVSAAIAWVKGNIANYGGDPERIFLMGHSAGAHLVSLIATDESYLEAEGLSLTDIKGVVSLDTQAYDLFTLMANLPEGNGDAYRVTFGDDPENWKALSPITYVATGKNIPPFFLAYTGDREDRHALTDIFAQRLLENGIPVVVLPATNKTHEQINAQFGLEGDYVTEAVFQWLEEMMKDK